MDVTPCDEERPSTDAREKRWISEGWLCSQAFEVLGLFGREREQEREREPARKMSKTVKNLPGFLHIVPQHRQ